MAENSENTPNKETWRSGVFFGIVSYILVRWWNPVVIPFWWLIFTVILSNTYRYLYLRTFKNIPAKVYPSSYMNKPIDFNDPDWTDKIDWSSGQDSVQTVPDPARYDPYDPARVLARQQLLDELRWGRGFGSGGNPPLAPQQPQRLLVLE